MLLANTSLKALNRSSSCGRMGDPTETLDRLSNELSALVTRRKELIQQEDEVKREIMEELKNNNLTVWAFERGKVSRQSRTFYKDWDLDSIRSKVGESSFPEVTKTTVKVSALRDKLEDMGIEEEAVEEFFSTAATRNESEWVVYRPKS